jgi:hypothetical protein
MWSICSIVWSIVWSMWSVCGIVWSIVWSMWSICGEVMEHSVEHVEHVW